MLKYGDLFSGMGCIPIALKELGIPFTYEFACDIDHSCKKNLLHNFDVRSFHNDVRNIDEKQLPYVDLLTGGFPCQPFSVTNKINPREKHKSVDLFDDLYRCLLAIRPKYFIFENVQGLTFKSNRAYLDKITAQLDATDYHWNMYKLDSKDYGSPVSRPRVWFIGSLQKIDLEFRPLHEMTLSDVLDLSLPFDKRFTDKTAEKVKGMKLQSGLYTDNGQSSGQFMRLRPLPQDYGYCLIAANVPHVVKIDDDGTITCRNWTVDEFRQCHDIPSWYQNACSDRQLQKQIGNGQDVRLLKIILTTLLG